MEMYVWRCPSKLLTAIPWKIGLMLICYAFAFIKYSQIDTQSFFSEGDHNDFSASKCIVDRWDVGVFYTILKM